jgi:tetratricopeptide (TPR) repeat protein
MEEEPKVYRAIMVSSTFTDLEVHRREVIDAIQRFGFYPNVMEFSGARSDADVTDASLRMVRESVAYLCVIGHKYGQTPVDTDRNPKGLSITELEFNEARRLGKPTLLFLMADDHPVTKGDVEPEAKKQKKLDAFRKQAKRVDPGKGAERVYETFRSKDEFAKKAAIAIGLQAIQIAGGSDLPDRAIRDAIVRFIDVKPDANQAELADAIDRFETGYRALERQLAAITVSDNRVTSLKVDAEAALAEGDLDKARTAYREAAEAARDKAAEPVRTAVELKSAEANAHLLALDWEAADAAWAQAETMLAPFDRSAADDLAENASERLSVQGRLYARAGALAAASNRWRTLTESADARGDESEAARLRNNLGNELTTRGEHTGGPAGLRLLEEAVIAFRAVIAVVTRGEAPTKWAIAQNNLGTTLAAQGRRTRGREGLRLLDQAVSAYRDALTVHTRADEPTQWATTQSNLGSALKTLGERTNGPAGLRLLDQAVAAHREALAVHNRASMPAQWATTQNNLGTALATQGRRTSGAKGLRLLDEAIAAYRNALTVHTRADMPANWAATQNNLGTALHTQGRRTGNGGGLRLLNEAVEAYRHALTVYTRAETPADWAMTQENIGLAFEAMADVDPTQARGYLLAAETALVAALEVYTPGDMPYYHDKGTLSLTNVRAKLAAFGT